MVRWLAAQSVVRIDAHVHPDHEASARVARNAGLMPTDATVDGEVVWRLRTQLTHEAG